MESKIAVIGIVIENQESSSAINEILHEYSQYIIGRMGVPYRERQIFVISLIVDASSKVINDLTSQLGRVPDVTSKAIYS